MNRRSFLKTLAAGAAALVAPIPEPVKRPVRSVAQRFGLIGDSVYMHVESGEILHKGDVVYLGDDGKAHPIEYVGQFPIGIALNDRVVLINGHLGVGSDDNS